MSDIYSELAGKGMRSIVKGVKSLVIILVLVFIAAVTAAYFIGRSAGEQAKSADPTQTAAP